jgi:hypothetical protein
MYEQVYQQCEFDGTEFFYRVMKSTKFPISEGAKVNAKVVEGFINSKTRTIVYDMVGNVLIKNT